MTMGAGNVAAKPAESLATMLRIRRFEEQRELVDLARTNPDTVNWASFGKNSTGYMYMEWLKRSAGAHFYHVPSKTMPQGLQALLAGESQVAVYGLSSIGPLWKAGRLKVLAVTSAKRQDWLPDVPSLEESRIKLPLRSWLGYHAPGGTPKDVVQWLNTEINRIQADAGYKESILAKQGIEAVSSTPEEFAAYLKANRQAVAELVEFIGLKPE